MEGIGMKAENQLYLISKESAVSKKMYALGNTDRKKRIKNFFEPILFFLRRNNY